jgi:hypothetical protein
MAVRNSYCGRDYDVILCEFDSFLTCDWGWTVKFKHEHIKDEALLAQIAKDRKVREIKNVADRIASLIVGSDYPMIDIKIEKQKLRERISELFPDKIDHYDLIYERRFRRLKEQFGW